MARKFVRYIGRVFLNGRGIAVYSAGKDAFEVRAEHIATGRKVAGTRTLTITAVELEQRTERWTDGLQADDAEIVARALQDLAAGVAEAV